MPPTAMPISLPLVHFKRAILSLLLALTGWTAVCLAHAVYYTGRTPNTMHWALQLTLAQGFLLLVSFAAYSALDHRQLRWFAVVGMVAAAGMLVLIPAYGWWEITDPAHIRQVDKAAHAGAYQLAATGVLTAGLLCLIPFALRPRMRRVARIIQWATVLYLFAAYFAAVLFLWHIETRRIDESLTTLLIPAGACMFGVFIQQKFLEVRHPDPLTSVAPSLFIRCPRCQREQSVGLGESRCCQCRLRFSIAVEEPRCPNCQFNLHHLTRPVCPECGLHLDAEDVAAGGRENMPTLPPEAAPEV